MNSIATNIKKVALLGLASALLLAMVFTEYAFAYTVPGECSGMTFDNVVEGTSGDDDLYGTNGRDLIFGYGGNDYIDGYAGDDCLVGGDGDDVMYIFGGSVSSFALGQAGNDSLNTSSLSNVYLLGGDGNDSIHGAIGTNFINFVATADGGNGTDTCISFTNNKKISCEY